MDLVHRALPHASPPVEAPVDGCLGQPGLAGDLADRIRMRHAAHSEGEMTDQRGFRTPTRLSGPLSPPPPRKDPALTPPASPGTNPGWFTTEECRLEDFRAVVETTTDLAEYPYA